MESDRTLREEVEKLRAAVRGLQSEVWELKRELGLQKHPVEAIMGQRGFPVISHGGQSQTLITHRASPTQTVAFYRLMNRYSFRLFLRDLIRYPHGTDLEPLARYCSMKTVRSYLRSLTDLGVVRMNPGRGYELVPKNVSSFGPTLEQHICEIFRREFLAPALFNVKLGNTRHGGDCDVVALLAGYLVYVEVKSSPPRGVELQAVSAFLNRLKDQQPHIAVFLVDTELRMKDKIAPLFEEALSQSGPQEEVPEVLRLADEIFHIRHGIYLMNSRKGIYSNLRFCFRDFFRCEKKEPTARRFLGAFPRSRRETE